MSQRVGEKGRVLAQDILPAVRDSLAERVNRERLDNVSVKLGLPGDPMLPSKSFDRVLMVHMYHEISAPYEFLWHLHPALRSGGRVIIVDADRPTKDHGTPPLLLQCEMEAVGYRLVEFQQTAFAGGYLAAYDAGGKRPEPNAIKPCTLQKPGG
jgi:SAM-dependent methyltransferase